MKNPTDKYMTEEGMKKWIQDSNPHRPEYGDMIYFIENYCATDKNRANQFYDELFDWIPDNSSHSKDQLWILRQLKRHLQR